MRGLSQLHHHMRARSVALHLCMRKAEIKIHPRNMLQKNCSCVKMSLLGYRLFSLTHSNICLMARPEDLVLYKVMPTRDIVKCSSINMTNARLISNRKHKLPSQHKFSALSCRRADRVDSGRRLHSRRPPCHLTPRTVREKHGEDTGRQWMQRSQRWWWKRDKRRDGEGQRDI